MKSKILLAALALAVVPTVASAETYNIVTGYQTGTNFTFGSGAAGTSFNAFTQSYPNGCFETAAMSCKTYNTNNEVPVAGYNTAATPTSFADTVTIPGNAVFLHPGANAGEDGIANFIAPKTSTYSFSGAFTRYSTVNGGDGVNVSVLGNGSTLSSGSISNGAGYGASSAFNGTVQLAAGQALTFAVNRNGEYQYDSTGLAAAISVVPEPATWAMMILGMGAVGGMLRRRKSFANAAIA